MDETGWKLRTLPIWKVKQAANLLAKDEARRIAANIASADPTSSPITKTAPRHGYSVQQVFEVW